MTRSLGVLFDIDELEEFDGLEYGIPCWRILMKHLELQKIRGAWFSQGDVEVQASKRPYCYCIAVSGLESGHLDTNGTMYIEGRLIQAWASGHVASQPKFLHSRRDDNFGFTSLNGSVMNGDITASLVPTGRVDSNGSLRMLAALGDLGDLRLVRTGRELGWTVLPDDDLLATFALTYLARTASDGMNLPLADDSRELCESILRDMGRGPTIAALRASGLSPGDVDSACERLSQQVGYDLAEKNSRWWAFWE